VKSRKDLLTQLMIKPKRLQSKWLVVNKKEKVQLVVPLEYIFIFDYYFLFFW